MSLDKAIRHKRYKVKEIGSVTLIIMSKLGETLVFNIEDCSLTGLSGTLVGDHYNPESLDATSIVPSAKLLFENQEISLGRLAVQWTNLNDSSSHIGFSTIDVNIPIDNNLSKFLIQNFDSESFEYDYEINTDKFNVSHFADTNYLNVDLFDRARKFSLFFRDWKKTDKFAYYMQRESSMGPNVNIKKKRKNGRNDYLTFASNDFLGMSANKEVIEAINSANNKYGFGATGSPPTTGHTDLHEKLMFELANTYGRESAILFPSGFSANLGAIAGLCREGDLIVSDILVHASILDGISLSKSTPRFYKHDDVQHLEKILLENRSKYNGCLIITEGAFSMDGTVSKLDEIYNLSRKYNARLLVDQAHCFGVVGKNGLGTVEKYDLKQETDIIMGTMSKSLGGIGGFIIGSKELCEWLKVFSRTYLFAASLPPGNCAGLIKSLELIKNTDVVQKIQRNIAHFKEGLIYLGAEVDSNHESANFPIEIRDETKMGIMYQSLLEDGIFSMPVVYPVVSRNRCRFRFSMRADFSITELDFALNSFDKAMMKANITFEQIKDLRIKSETKNKKEDDIVYSKKNKSA